MYLLFTAFSHPWSFSTKSPLTKHQGWISHQGENPNLKSCQHEKKPNVRLQIAWAMTRHPTFLDLSDLFYFGALLHDHGYSIVCWLFCSTPPSCSSIPAPIRERSQREGETGYDWWSDLSAAVANLYSPDPFTTSVPFVPVQLLYNGLFKSRVIDGIYMCTWINF